VSVPTDYRLDHVGARLIERLEGSRRAWEHRPDTVSEETQRITKEHVSRAIEEMEEVAMMSRPDLHAEFLRRELGQQLVPRYEQLATDMNRVEAGGFGMGPLAKPLGRLGLILGSLFGIYVLLRLIYLPVVWPLFLIDASVPFWPDITRWVHKRRYTAALNEIVDDLHRIQEQEGAYLSREELTVEEPTRRPSSQTDKQ
jgi:hypothetical protein